MVIVAAHEFGDGEMRRAVRAAGLAVALSCTPALAEDPSLLQKYQDWSAYGTASDPKVCFAVAQPKDMSPKGVKRGPVYFYVSQWPAEKVVNEVSVKMGYPFKPGGTVAVSVGGDKFELFTKEEGAFVEKPETETSLIEAMRKGGTMKIEGTSMRGTKTTDTYSLSGAGDALDRIAKDCGS
jgi:invasion associated locus B (IalB) protein